MNNEQLAAALRSLASALLAFAAGKGWISSNDIVTLTPLIGSAALLAWGIWARRDAAKVAAAKTVPGVAEIKVDTVAAAPAVAAIALSNKPEDVKVTPV